MAFRFARHTHDLKPLVSFYSEVIGLQLLSHFENHDGYDGIILGFPDGDWQLEFTATSDEATHTFDQDDNLIFYVHTEAIADAIVRDALKLKYEMIQPKNPYWIQHGKALRDPDGHTVIIAFKQRALDANCELTKTAHKRGIYYWDDLVQFVKNVPYGRNTSRTSFFEVLTDNKGTCSTKHALLKNIAEENRILHVQLVCGIYRMTERNTPGIGDVLTANQLEYIPEAHCYLLLHGKRIDLTFPSSDIGRIESDILTEIEIEPLQVGEYKVQFHQEWLKSWIDREKIGRSFEEVWRAREQCIARLST